MQAHTPNFLFMGLEFLERLVADVQGAQGDTALSRVTWITFRSIVLGNMLRRALALICCARRHMYAHGGRSGTGGLFHAIKAPPEPGGRTDKVVAALLRRRRQRVAQLAAITEGGTGADEGMGSPGAGAEVSSAAQAKASPSMLEDPDDGPGADWHWSQHPIANVLPSFSWTKREDTAMLRKALQVHVVQGWRGWPSYIISPLDWQPQLALSCLRFDFSGGTTSRERQESSCIMVSRNPRRHIAPFTTLTQRAFGGQVPASWAFLGVPDVLHLILDVYEEVHGVRTAGVGDASTTESIHTQCLEIIVEVQRAAPCLAHLLLSAF